MHGQVTGISGPITAPRKLISLNGFVAALCTFDLFILVFLGLLVGRLHFGVLPLWGPRALVILMALMVGWLVFRSTKLHDRAILERRLPQLRKAVTATGLIFFIILFAGYATRTIGDYSRLWVGGWFLSTLVVLSTSRLLVFYLFKKLNALDAFAVRYVILSTDAEISRLEKFIERWRTLMPASHRISGIFVEGLDRVNTPLSLPAHLLRGDFAEFETWADRTNVDKVIAILPSHDSAPVEQLLSGLREMPLDVDIVAGDVDQKWAPRAIEQVAGVPAIRIMSKPLSDGQIAVKRVFDIAVAGVALVLLTPVFILIAAAIKIDTSGPVLFHQKRLGFNNVPFMVLKFRTMFHEEKVLTTVEQARRNDPRVTHIGALLRRTSLDELPQLINVLRGDMSIVGPRPLAVEHNRQYAPLIDAYLARHRIKPGITGWAQVNGFRGETETLAKMNERIVYDLHYVDNWSLSFDVEIMIRTAAVLVHRNAY